MKFSERTPKAVRQAVVRYVGRRRRLVAAATVAAGLAVLGLLVLLCLLLDRCFEMPADWRAPAPLLVLAAAGAGALWIVVRWFGYRPDPLQVAIDLDHSLPQNRDGWSTSIDLADRQADGADIGDPACVERVFASVADADPAAAARSVSTRRLRLHLAALAGIAALWVLFSTSVDMPLLWQRFWHPHDNLPRDSLTVIEISEINGVPSDGRTFPAVPEGRPLTFAVRLGQKQSLLFRAAADDWRPPYLELLTSSGIVTHELVRDGEMWRFSQPAVNEAMTFRIRAGDALTALYTQDVLPRLRFQSITHSLRFPRYTRLDDIEAEPFAARRLTVLNGTRAQFDIGCDRRWQSFEATFELLQRSGDQGRVLMGDELLRQGRGGEVTTEAQRRQLAVRRRGESGAQLRLLVDHDGVLRFRAQGENGLWSDEVMCVVEATDDGPPRVTLSGLAEDTTIMPGETVALNYQVEDDYAVTDLVIVWGVAGGANTHDLAGEEYIRNDDFGQRLVTGQELIQRMDYKVYATAPFEFYLVAYDSKGQESRTPKYRIHIMDDDFAARYERALEQIEACRASAVAHRSYHSQLENQLNIIGKAVGDAKVWPAAQDQLLTDYLQMGRHINHQLTYGRFYRERFGGFPDRVDRVAVALILPQIVLPGPAEVQQVAAATKTTQDLPRAIGELKTMHQRVVAVADQWAATAAAMLAEFRTESARQKLAKLDRRLAALIDMRANPDLYNANLDFYLSEVAGVVSGVASLNDQTLAPLLSAMTAAAAAREVDRLHERATALILALGADTQIDLTSLDSFMQALVAAAADDAGIKRRFMAAVGETMRARGQEAILSPGAVIGLAPSLITGTLPDGHYLTGVAAAADFGPAVAQIAGAVSAHRIDLQTGRHDLYPDAAHNRDEELREHLLSIAEMARRCPTLSPAAQQQALAILDRAAAQLVSARVAADGDALERQLQALAAELQAAFPAGPLAAEWARLSATLDWFRTQLLAHGAACRALAADRAALADDSSAATEARLAEDSMSLMFCAEGIDAYARAIRLLVAKQQLTAPVPTEWPSWQPLHALQLALTFTALRMQERLAARHDSRPRDPDGKAERYGVIANSCDASAALLVGLQPLLAALRAGGPAAYDYDALEKEMRSIGYLSGLRDEHAFVQPFLSATVDQASMALLNESRLGRIARSEEMFIELSAIRPLLQTATAADLATAKARLGAAAARAGEDGDTELAATLTQILQTLAAGKVGGDSIAEQRRLSALRDQLAETCDGLRAAVALPPIDDTAQRNRRFTNARGLSYLWTIQGIVDGFDRRWVARMRQAELALSRSLVARSRVKTGATAARVATDYAHLLELRARNIANERRRNQGISFLAQDDSSRLRLPRHIAVEFFDARNRAAPGTLKAATEGYLDDLFRDFSE